MEIKLKDSNSFQILIPRCLVVTVLVALIYFLSVDEVATGFVDYPDVELLKQLDFEFLTPKKVDMGWQKIIGIRGN